MKLHTSSQRGFTLIEVLVALGITAVALMAGLQATGALSRNAERQTLSMLGQNALKTSSLPCVCAGSFPIQAIAPLNASRRVVCCKSMYRCVLPPTRTFAASMPAC